MTREYPVVYEWAGKNFSGYAPDVPGCMATAKTLPAMRAALKGSLTAHLQWMKDDGDSLPLPSEFVTVSLEPDKEFPHPRGYYVVVERLGVTLSKAKTSSNGIAGANRVRSKRRELQTA